VAREYAGGKNISLFEMKASQIDRGSFIGEFSYYTEEDEHVGKRREGGVNIELQLKVNGKPRPCR
jgi:hypothetical protein